MPFGQVAVPRGRAVRAPSPFLPSVLTRLRVCVLPTFSSHSCLLHLRKLVNLPGSLTCRHGYTVGRELPLLLPNIRLPHAIHRNFGGASICRPGTRDHSPLSTPRPPGWTWSGTGSSRPPWSCSARRANPPRSSAG